MFNWHSYVSLYCWWRKSKDPRKEGGSCIEADTVKLNFYKQVGTAATPGVTTYYLSCSESLLPFRAAGSAHREAEKVSAISQNAVPWEQMISLGDDGSHWSSHISFPTTSEQLGKPKNNSGHWISLTKPQKAQIKLSSLKLERDHHL